MKTKSITLTIAQVAGDEYTVHAHLQPSRATYCGIPAVIDTSNAEFNPGQEGNCPQCEKFVRHQLEMGELIA